MKLSRPQANRARTPISCVEKAAYAARQRWISGDSCRRAPLARRLEVAPRVCQGISGIKLGASTLSALSLRCGEDRITTPSHERGVQRATAWWAGRGRRKQVREHGAVRCILVRGMFQEVSARRSKQAGGGATQPIALRTKTAANAKLTRSRGPMASSTRLGSRCATRPGLLGLRQNRPRWCSRQAASVHQRLRPLFGASPSTPKDLPTSKRTSRRSAASPVLCSDPPGFAVSNPTLPVSAPPRPASAAALGLQTARQRYERSTPAKRPLEAEAGRLPAGRPRTGDRTIAIRAPVSKAQR